MATLMERFEGLDTWEPGEEWGEAELERAGIQGELAEVLGEVGACAIGEHGGQFYVLDPDGVELWTGRVRQKIQAIATPATLHTFFIDEGGGTYAFACDGAVFTYHFRDGLLEAFDGPRAFLEAAVERIARGESPFADGGDAEALAKKLAAAPAVEKESLAYRFRGRADEDFPRYDPHRKWEVGQLMRHRKLGRGVVVAVETTMYIQVEFESGLARLSHKGW